jgi:restriction system protein
MKIVGFLLELGCLILVAWAIALVTDAVSGRKRRQQNRHQKPLSLTPPEIQERNSLQPTITAPPPPSAPPRKVVALRQPTSTRVRQTSNRHQQYIRLGDSVLKRLRDRITVVQLPKALGILRKMNPYAFEELLLTCCHEQGWEIERNFRYSNDGGIDGGVLIAGKLYLVQAKRYKNYINPKHIRELDSAPEPLLVAVLDFIQSKKAKITQVSNQSSTPRIPGLHQGEIWMSEDFNEPLADEFWLGEDE